MPTPGLPDVIVLLLLCLGVAALVKLIREVKKP
jgi:hypothetical protein